MQRAVHCGFYFRETCRVGTAWSQKADLCLPGLGRVWGLMAEEEGSLLLG